MRAKLVNREGNIPGGSRGREADRGAARIAPLAQRSPAGGEPSPWTPQEPEGDRPLRLVITKPYYTILNHTTLYYTILYHTGDRPLRLVARGRDQRSRGGRVRVWTLPRDANLGGFLVEHLARTLRNRRPRQQPHLLRPCGRDAYRLPTSGEGVSVTYYAIL